MSSFYYSKFLKQKERKEGRRESKGGRPSQASLEIL